MSELTKTKAIVLRKINYGDTSKIAQFYTENFGKISAIIKGARSSKSRIGMMIDTFNLVQIILYKKETREVQIISDVDLIQHYINIKEDLNKLKYASAIVELLINLTIENDPNNRLFNGTIRIFELLNKQNYDPQLLFVKYFLFFMKEIGYEINPQFCSVCKRKLNPTKKNSFNYESGILCDMCREERLVHFDFTKELLILLQCLNSKIFDIKYKKDDLETIIKLLEKFIKYHINEFKGLKSLELS